MCIYIYDYIWDYIGSIPTRWDAHPSMTIAVDLIRQSVKEQETLCWLYRIL